MPRIQEYRQRVGISADTPRVRGPSSQPASSFGTGGAGSGALARGLEDIGQTVNQMAQEQDHFEAKKFSIQAQSEWEKKADELQRGYLERLEENRQLAASGQPKKEIPDFATTFQQEFENWENKTLETASFGSSARRSIALDFTGFKSRSLNQAIEFDSKARAQQNRIEIESIQNTHLNQIAAQPGRRDEKLKEFNDLVEAMPSQYVNPQVKAKLVQEATNAFWDKSLESRILGLQGQPNLNPAAVDKLLKEIKDEKNGYVKNNSEVFYSNAIKDLDRLKTHAQEQRDYNFELDFAAEVDRIRTSGADSGLFQENEIRRTVKDKAKAERMVRMREAASAEASAFDKVKSLPHSEVVQYLDGLSARIQTPSPDNQKNLAEHQAAISALQRRQTEIQKDFVGYAHRQSPALDALFDSANRETDEGLRAKKQDAYFNALEMEQKKLSPGTPVSYLSQAKVEEVRSVMGKLTQDPTGVASAVSYVQNMSKEFGPRWQQAVMQLKKEKAANSSQVIAAALANEPDKTHLAEEFMKASVQSPQELSKNTGLKLDAVRAAARNALLPLVPVMDSQVDGQDFIETHTDAISQYILYKGLSPNDADDIADALIYDKYYVAPTYRVPKTENFPAIENATNRILLGDYLDRLPINPPRDMRGFKKEDVISDYLKRLKQNGKFINSGNGLLLVDEWGNQVTQKAGGKDVPLEFSWAELESLQMALEPPPVDIPGEAFAR